MTVTLKLSHEEETLIKSYEQMKGVTMSEFIRTCVIEHIEDECDLKCYKKAFEEYKNDPVTYTIDQAEVMCTDSRLQPIQTERHAFKGST